MRSRTAQHSKTPNPDSHAPGRNTGPINRSRCRPGRRQEAAIIDHEHDIIYIYSKCFECDPQSDQGKEILSDMPGLAEYRDKMSRMKAPVDSTPEMAVAYLYPVLNKEQEAHLFRKMNYLKHLAYRAVKDGRKNEYSKRLAESIEIHKFLVCANFRLAVSVVKKYVSKQHGLFDIIDESMFPLMNSITRFNYLFGYKFSTYAYWAIARWCYKYKVPDAQSPYTNIDDYVLEKFAGEVEIDYDAMEVDEQIDEAISKIFGCMDDRERMIVKLRNGMGPKSPAGKYEWTLSEIGEKYGLSKERVRQIQSKAYKKAREKYQTDGKSKYGIMATSTAKRIGKSDGRCTRSRGKTKK